jgi:2-amino-4-hydroxy-6-hydroxymethyldihydropteridine diphosphokinase
VPIIYLALGSNLGDRLANLYAAVEALAPKVRVLAESGIYETPPWGYTEQPAFLNMVLKAETRLVPPVLLKHLKESAPGGKKVSPRPVEDHLDNSLR